MNYPVLLKAVGMEDMQTYSSGKFLNSFKPGNEYTKIFDILIVFLFLIYNFCKLMKDFNINTVDVIFIFIFEKKRYLQK